MFKIILFTAVILFNLFSLVKAEEIVQNQFVVIFPVTLISPGLANDLVKMFEEEYKIPTKMISLCTGDAIKLIRAGSERIDALVTHDPEAEEKLVRDGFALTRRPLCYSDYYLVGPPEDPAGIKGMTSVTETLKKIRDKKLLFFSRGDDSGTHKLEMKMWQKANIQPSGSWYIITKADTDVTLTLASRKKGYFITHSATYLDMQETINLAIMLKSPDLVTPYHVMAINPQKYPNVDYLNALKFIEFLTSSKVQKYISAYGIEKYKGRTFFPLIEEVKNGSKNNFPGDIKFSGYLQVQYIVDESTNPDNILIRRARLIASSNISDKIDWKIMLDGTSTPILWEACMNYAASAYAKITAGQFKVPFSAEYLTSSSKSDTIENCQAVTKLAPQYDLGATINGNSGIFGYSAGIFNGEGRNKTDTNKDRDAVARILLTPKKDIEIGVAYYAATSGVKRDKRNCSDVSLCSTLFNKLSIKGEYVISKEKALDRQGGYFQLMYKISSSLEPLVRYDTYDPDTGILDDVTYIYLAGLNYYINSNAKIQANYLIKQEKPEIKNSTFYIQSQVSF